MYLRLFRFNSRQGGDFDICLFEIDIPINDNCADAIELPVSDNCELATYSNVFSTSQEQDVAPIPPIRREGIKRAANQICLIAKPKIHEILH